MNYKVAFLGIFFSLLLNNSFAQESFQLSGKVLDSKTKDILVFVNIGIEGTLIGTASNAFGDFTLKIPNELADRNLYFSAIGYENLTFPIAKYNQQNPITKLDPLSYGIDDIEISSQSKVLYRIIRQTSKSIAENYINKALNYKAIVQNEVYINDTLDKKRDALLLLSDLSGYGNRKNSFESINYKVLNVERNFDIISLEDGTMNIDDVLAFDLVRTTGNIFQISYLNEYDLELIEDTVIDGDSVSVIAYRLFKPDISRTGDLNAIEYKGKLYISKESNVLLKAETHIKSAKHSKHGRTIFVEKSNAFTNVDYHVTTTYKKSSSEYYLDRISMTKNYTNSSNQTVKETSSLIVVSVTTNQPTLLKKRQYYENMVSDPDFWLSNKLSK
ncbi:MAG: carboxypeptidase-like regulatory domain-containing protein [Prolixibacteraceae bacterium]|jgi:hypothetical protein|nr:carboxypeptidase-like regulatory domain-containing protein [Prolixibacteraceae bacterium]